jgi:hypothetical protein
MHLARLELGHIVGGGKRKVASAVAGLPLANEAAAAIHFARSRATEYGSPWHGNAGSAAANVLRRFEDAPAPLFVSRSGGSHVSKSVLDAIREGDWFFEPEEVDSASFQATKAIPGTRQKLDVLAARARAGLPLWHENDRADYDQSDYD